MLLLYLRYVCSESEYSIGDQSLPLFVVDFFKVYIGPRSILWCPWYPLFWTSDNSAHGFQARVDSWLPALFCSLHATMPRVISGCQDRASNNTILIVIEQLVNISGSKIEIGYFGLSRCLNLRDLKFTWLAVTKVYTMLTRNLSGFWLSWKHWFKLVQYAKGNHLVHYVQSVPFTIASNSYQLVPAQRYVRNLVLFAMQEWIHPFHEGAVVTCTTRVTRLIYEDWHMSS